MKEESKNLNCVYLNQHEEKPTRIDIRPGTEDPVTVYKFDKETGEKNDEGWCQSSGCPVSKCCDDEQEIAFDADTTVPFQGRAIALDSRYTQEPISGYTSVTRLGTIQVEHIDQTIKEDDEKASITDMKYANVLTDKGIESENINHPPMPQAAVFNDEGQLIASDGYVAMTAYGAVPVPQETLEQVPRYFYTQPVVQERDVFVTKPEVCERISEKTYTQYEHSFVEIDTKMQVDRLVPQMVKQEVEFPKYVFTEYVEEKVIEIPQGVKYVEVPIEVPMQRPAVIVPVEKQYIVERVVHETKPIVQEKIIEEEEIITKRVPRVIVKELPYVIPRYVEHIVEVPFLPDEKTELPKERSQPSEHVSIPDTITEEIVLPDWSVIPESVHKETLNRGLTPEETSTLGLSYKTDDNSTTPQEVRDYLLSKNSLPSDQTSTKVLIEKPLIADTDLPSAEINDGTLTYTSSIRNPRPHTVFTKAGLKKIEIPYECDIQIDIIKGEPPEDVQLLEARNSTYTGILPCCHSGCCTVGECCKGASCGANCCGINAERKTLFRDRWNRYVNGEILEQEQTPMPRYSTLDNENENSTSKIPSRLLSLSEVPYPDVEIEQPPAGSQPHPQKQARIDFITNLKEKYGEGAVFAAPLEPLVKNDATSIGRIGCRSTTKNTKVLTSRGEVSAQKIINNDITTVDRPCCGLYPAERANSLLIRKLPDRREVPQTENGVFDAPKLVEWQEEMQNEKTYAGFFKLFDEQKQKSEDKKRAVLSTKSFNNMPSMLREDLEGSREARSNSLPRQQ